MMRQKMFIFAACFGDQAEGQICFPIENQIRKDLDSHCHFYKYIEFSSSSCVRLFVFVFIKRHGAW